MKNAAAWAYSSSANLGPGFDTLGLAHDAGRNKVSVEFLGPSEKPELRLVCDGLPTDPGENTASLAIESIMESRGIAGNLRITVTNEIPMGLGLGCSGASAAAAVVAMDALLDLNLTMDEKVYFAMLGETASSGTPHADNVAASIYGGLVSIQSLKPMKVKPVNVSDNFTYMTVVPKVRIESKTKMSRSLVPKSISMSEHIEQIRYTSLLLHGFMSGDSDSLRYGMNDDVVEKARLEIFPFYPEVKEMALAHGAAGVCISGAGPSVLMALDNNTDAESILNGVQKLMDKSGLKYSIFRSKAARGAYVEKD
jgi:homoserine kinase